MGLEKTYQSYKDRADFYLVYLKEAHATDGKRPARHIEIAQHKTLEDRKQAAQGCATELKLTMPMLLDDMKNSVGDAFHGHPDRLFILSPDGTIAYRGDRGPRGFNIKEMTAALELLVAGKK